MDDYEASDEIEQYSFVELLTVTSVHNKVRCGSDLGNILNRCNNARTQLVASEAQQKKLNASQLLQQSWLNN